MSPGEETTQSSDRIREEKLRGRRRKCYGIKAPYLSKNKTQVH